MSEYENLKIGGLYHYTVGRRIIFYGPKGDLLISIKPDELIPANETFILLGIGKLHLNTFRCKILSAKGIIGYIDARSECILKIHGENQ